MPEDALPPEIDASDVGVYRATVVTLRATDREAFLLAGDPARIVFGTRSTPLTSEQFASVSVVDGVAVVDGMRYRIVDVPGTHVPLRIALRHEEDTELVSLATEGAEAGWWYWEIESGRFEASDRALSMYGLAPGTRLTPDVAHTAVHPDDEIRVRGELATAIEGDGRFRSEHRVVGGDGKVRWLLSTARTFSEGPTKRMVGFVIDVTERRRAIEEAWESRARLQAIFDGAREFAIVAMDEDGRVTEWSRGAEELTGYTESETLGRTIEFLFTPGDRLHGIPGEELRLARENGRAPDDRYLVRKDGEQFWADGTVTPFNVRGSNVQGYVKLFCDRTEAKRNEGALLKSEARFRAVQETSVDGFMTLEAVREEGRIVDFVWTHANEAASRIVGKDVSWFLGQRLLEQMPGNREEGLFDAYVRVVETGEPEVRELRYRHENADIYIRLVAAKVGDGFAVSFADLSERRRAEEAVRESEARFRALAEDAPMFIWLADAEGNVEYANASMRHYLGVRSLDGAAAPEAWLKTVHPEDHDRVLTAFRQAVEGRHAYSQEVRYLQRETDEYEWHLLRGVPRLVSGRFQGFIGTGVNIHSRKLAEEAVVAERRLLDAVLDALPVGVIIAEPNGRLIRFNSANEELWGTNRAAAGVDAYEGYRGFWVESGVRLRPEDWAMSRAVTDGLAVKQLIEIERFDRPERRTIINTGAPVRNERGEIFAGVVAQLDVTDRMRAERALRESEERLRASETRFKIASGAISGIVFDWDLQSDTVWRSEGFEKVTGFSPDEVPSSGTWWFDRVHPEDAESIRRRLAREGLDGDDYSVEYRMRHRDGEFRICWERGTRLRDPDGRIVRVIGSTVDVTEERAEALRERALADLSERLRSTDDPTEVLNGALDGLRAMFDVDGATYGELAFDGSAEILRIGQERRADEGEPILVGDWSLSDYGTTGEALARGESLAIGDVRDLDPAAYRLLAERGVGSFLLRTLVRDGRMVAVLGVYRAERREWTTEDIRLIGRAADRCWEAIARAQASQDLKDLNARLEEIVRERTDELREAIRELEGFNYSVAHDLRAPLRNIAAQVNITAEDFGAVMPAGAMENLRRIERSAGSLGRLVDDLLEFSRLGRREARRAPVDLSAVAERVVNGLPESFRALGTVEVEPGLTAEGDRELIAMVLENLIGNALKYSRKGVPNDVRFGMESPGVFYVADRGIGFDASFAERIFLPFERLHRAEVPGTGIGLANVRRIIEKHRGRVWAEGREDEGAVFRFTLDRDGTE